METMVPYHFFIIWMLSLLSTATHISTLLALVNDFKRDWVLRWLRQFLMFINLVLSCVSGVFVLMSAMKNMAPTLPISCAWELPSHGAPPNAGISIAGTIAVIAGQCIFFGVGVWYLHIKARRWIKTIQMTGLLVLVAIGVGAAIRVILLSQAFGTPSVSLNDMAEKDWSFGQLLPLLLLLLPLVSTIEIIRGKFIGTIPEDRLASSNGCNLGEMRVPPPVVDNHIPLDDKQSSFRVSFQPNPWWGSQER
jgi:hypothetical protein